MKFSCDQTNCMVGVQRMLTIQVLLLERASSKQLAWTPWPAFVRHQARQTLSPRKGLTGALALALFFHGFVVKAMENYLPVTPPWSAAGVRAAVVQRPLEIAMPSTPSSSPASLSACISYSSHHASARPHPLPLELRQYLPVPWALIKKENDG